MQSSDNVVLEKRLYWQSRRGWLELDLLLERFWQRYSNHLSGRELSLLARWLNLDDEQLWASLKQPRPEEKQLANKILD